MNAPLKVHPTALAGIPMPKPHGALAAYIAADKEFRGIGPALAARLEERYGSDLHAAFAVQDAGIVEILGPAIAEAAFAAFEVKAHETDLLDWLERQGVAEVIGVPTAIRIARCWGREGTEALIDNPYLLIAFLPWEAVEKMAATLGIEPDDPRRAVAAVEATLYARLEANDTLVSEAQVEAGVAKLLNGVAAPAGPRAAIDAAVETGGASRLGDGVQPFGAAVMEEFIAHRIADAVASEVYHDLLVIRPGEGEIEERIAAFDRAQPYPLTDRQREAIEVALTRRVMVLAGYAGSGKTTSLRAICDIATDLGRDLQLLALSGRAAQRMAEATGRPARTIAGFLKAISDAKKTVLAPGSMVIVDEASMIDLPTLWRIMRALGDASLVLVGDPAQLPPIGFGLTFHVLCDAETVPAVVLDQVMRQKAESGIPAVAEAVRFGREPALSRFDGAAPGVFFLESTPEKVIEVITTIGKRLLATGADFGDTQIIAPVRSGPAGIDAMNRAFHRARLAASDGDFFPGRADIAEGDPILWVRNDWDRELMNGSMGRLHSVIDGVGHATLDGKPYELTEADAEMIELAYAISVHKAQGSQWPRVIIPVFPSRLLDRTLLYTAVTRAAEQVILVGDRQTLLRAVEEPPRSILRTVGLGMRLKASLPS